LPAPAPVAAPSAATAPAANAPPPASQSATVAAANPPAAQPPRTATPAAPGARVAAPTAGSGDAAAAQPGAVNFDPLTLNPDENGRLRVDLQRVPPNVELILVMDGKVFMRRSAAEFEKNNDDMYLPPGVHEFRVRARSGPLLKISNIVSADFQAKKRLTLRVELRIPPGLRGTSPTPQQIAAASSVFVTLR
jgi:hypothetical protein